jgi:anti-sigma factor RsiW
MPDSSERCAWIEERIELYVDGELHGRELETIERHLQSCESCREELSLARAVVGELRSLPSLECPERVVEEAAVRVGEDAAASSGWLDRLRDRFGGRFVPLPRPAMAAMLIVIAAVSVFVITQHPFNGTSDRQVSEKELELARLDVQLAFAYLGKYSRRTGDIVKQEVITDRVMKPIGKTVADPIYPFPREE